MKTKEAKKTSAISMGELCAANRILSQNLDRTVRIPFLINGQLRFPGAIERTEIEQEFAKKEARMGVSDRAPTYIRVRDIQVLREPVIDRRTMERTGEYIYQVMPTFDPEEVIIKDMDWLANELYSLDFTEIVEYAQSLSRVFTEEKDCVESVRRMSLETSELPDIYHNPFFDSWDVMLDPKVIKDMVDQDLTRWGLPGHLFLDSWIKINADLLPAPVNLASGKIFKEEYEWSPAGNISLRAMPTRQLHITAGNSPQIPLISALRAIITKSAAVVKSPYGATLPGALLAVAAYCAEPDHPLTKALSIVYWPGGDSQIEDKFYFPGSFDRIVVWGAPDAVASVKSKAVFTKVTTFNPRYGMSFIGKEAFESAETLRAVAIRGVCDSLIANQKSCMAAQVHYVEGSEEQIENYAAEIKTILADFDREAPNYVPPQTEGDVKRLQRGKFLNGQWAVNTRGDRYSSAVVVLKDSFPIACHPMNRMIIVRPIDSIDNAVQYLHESVSTVSIFPEERRVRLRDKIAARGVSNIMKIGHSGTGYAGQSHDGMMVLGELVDWKNSIGD